MLKKFLSVILIIVLMLPQSSLISNGADTTSGKCGDNATWSYDESTKTFTVSGTGEMYDYSNSNYCPWYSTALSSIPNNAIRVVIEDGITKIGNCSFENFNDLSTVVMADSVIEIGEYAFNDCSRLRNITWSNNLKIIGNRAFSKSYFVNLEFPDSLEVIGAYAFYYCDYLKTVRIPDGVTRIEDFTFTMCQKLSDIYLSDNITYIGEAAFGGTRISSIALPSKLETIGYMAFSVCDLLENIYIPASVKSIGAAAFSSCERLTFIDVDDANENYTNDEYGCLYFNDMQYLCQYPSGRTEKYYEVPESVWMIRESAFSANSYIENISLPSSLYWIGKKAFVACSNLKTVVIPEGVYEISEDAFSGCSNLSTFVIKEQKGSLHIYKNVFYNCSKLNFVHYLGDSTSWKSKVYVNSTENSIFKNGLHYAQYIQGTDGVESGWYCPTCESYVLNEDLELCTHENITNINSVNATCTASGYTGDTVCDKCGETLSTGTTTNPLNHDMGEWNVTVPATCENTGEERSDCSRCDYYETKVIPAKNHKDENNDGFCDDEDCKENICEHTNTTLVNAKASTCTENGYTGDTVCDKCGNVLSTGSVINPLNHDMGEWVVTVPATCENAGEERSDCSRCDYYETKVIAAKKHIDNDDDGICDDCQGNIPDSPEDIPSIGGDTGNNDSTGGKGSRCFCNCHCDNPIISFFYKIVRFLRMIFGLNYCRKCDCPYV